MHLARFARVRFAHLPTPLEPMPNLTGLLGGAQLYVKRDDCTGLATGGNKTRKLEFLIGDALAQGADTLITHGAVQSNHVRQTAAAARKFGLKCAALLERRVPGYGPTYETAGNVLLDRLLGAALGYVNAALELLQQANDLGVRIDGVVHATGSTGTQSGLVCGLEGANAGIDVLGVCVRRPAVAQEEAVYATASATAEFVGVRGGLERARVRANGDYVGPGYGIPTQATVDAIRLAAEHEGLLLDPVYSGKAMAGLIDLCRRGFFTRGQNVVFLHTGGATALFAYEHDFPAKHEAP